MASADLYMVRMLKHLLDQPHTEENALFGPWDELDDKALDLWTGADFTTKAKRKPPRPRRPKRPPTRSRRSGRGSGRRVGDPFRGNQYTGGIPGHQALGMRPYRSKLYPNVHIFTMEEGAKMSGARHAARILSAMREHFGKDVTPDTLAHMMGADLVGDRRLDLTISVYTPWGRAPGKTQLNLNMRDERGQFQCSRSYIDGKASHNSLYLPKSFQGRGLGTKIFGRHVAAYLKGGTLKWIETEAARSSSMNGHYTWARLGFDGEAYEGSNVTTISAIMATKSGRERWRRSGTGFLGIFSLKKGSYSRRTFESYVRGRFGGND